MIFVMQRLKNVLAVQIFQSVHISHPTDAVIYIPI